MDKKRILLIMVIVILIALIGVLVYGYYKKLTNEVKNPIVTMEIADYGTIKIGQLIEWPTNGLVEPFSILCSGPCRCSQKWR